MQLVGEMEKLNPAGFIDLSDLDDGAVEGIASAARGSSAAKTLGCCWCLPWYSSFTRCGTICEPQYCR